MKKYKYLLFDNDGTLMDFKKNEEYALEIAYKLSGAHNEVPYSENVLRLYSEINDLWWKKLERKECTREELMLGRFKDFLIALGVKNVEPEFLSDNYPKCLANGAFLYDGAKELMEELSKVYDIYIITNGIGFVQKSRIEKCEYLPYIKGTFISEEVGAVKPEKEYFDAVLKEINASNDDCLIIGDSLTADIKGGINALIDTVWFNPLKSANKTDVTPTYIAENYTDIIKLLL